MACQFSPSRICTLHRPSSPLFLACQKLASKTLSARVILDDGLWHAKNLVEDHFVSQGTFTHPLSYEEGMATTITPYWEGLSELQWEGIHRIFSGYRTMKERDRLRRKRRGRGRAPASDKQAFEAILWTLWGGTLERLPSRFGSRRTACRRLAKWEPRGLLEKLWGAYFDNLDEPTRLRWAERLEVLESRRQPFWREELVERVRLQLNAISACRRSSPTRSRPASAAGRR